MSITSTPTKLPLATWAKILGLHPLHFAGVDYVSDDRSRPNCDAPMMQYPWQESDRVSREEVAMAINEAETLLETYLGWYLIPTWTREEWTRIPRPWRPEDVARSSQNIRGYPQTLNAKWGKFISGGVQAKSLIEAASAIVWVTDAQTGIITGSTTATVTAGQEECEIEAYYPGFSGADEYQIRPISVSIVGTTATITFRRELCVLQDIMENLVTRGAVYATDADFLATVDIYRRYNDPSTQVTLMWENTPCGVCNGDGDCATCQYSVQTGCLHLRTTPDNPVLAWTPAEWDADTETFSPRDWASARQPDLARLFYYSGLQGASGCARAMDMRWARIVTYLSVTLLERPMCDCTANVWAHWREDIAATSGGEQDKTYDYFNRESASGNPFGSRRGAVYAWARVKDPDVAQLSSGLLV